VQETPTLTYDKYYSNTYLGSVGRPTYSTPLGLTHDPTLEGHALFNPSLACYRIGSVIIRGPPRPQVTERLK
jgi:hypothetical protein